MTKPRAPFGDQGSDAPVPNPATLPDEEERLWRVSMTFGGYVRARTWGQALVTLRADLGVVDEDQRTAHVTDVRATEVLSLGPPGSVTPPRS